MAGLQRCQLCGAVLAAGLDHAPFCSPRCRAAWNREGMGDAGTLAWSVAAMSEATGRLALVRAGALPLALTALREAVWWITMVDATLVRHHLRIYEEAFEASGRAERFRTGQTLTGLCFVRDQMGTDADLAGVVDTSASDAVGRRVTSWRWRRLSEPRPAGSPHDGRDRPAAGYRAYQGQLAGRTIGETIGLAVTFLTLTGASAASAVELRARAADIPRSEASSRPPDG